METEIKTENTEETPKSENSESSVNKSNKNQKSKKGRSKVLYFWSSADVNKWLKKHCRQYFQLYGDLFTEHDISGRALIRLNDYKLQEMGIESITHREELMRNILRLKLKAEYQELQTLDQRVGVTFERK